ncbi:MAG: acyltransferase [Planctomycetota bacterium]
MSNSTNFSREELHAMGFAELGENVMVDRSVRFFGAARIHLGSQIRIDAYSVLSAGSEGLRLGSRVHLAVGVRFLGGEKVTVEDFCGLSSGVCVFGSNDDYSGGALTNPTVPEAFRDVASGPVLFRKHAIVGANSVVMPNVTLGVAASVGALTFVNKSVPDFAIVNGNPMRKIGTRDTTILEREKEFLEHQDGRKEQR